MAVVSQERPAVRQSTKVKRFWWGDGPPPQERWPGVTLTIPTVWRSATSRWETPDGRYYFDMDAADRAMQFFPDVLRHHMGEFAGRPFHLMDYQAQLQTRPVFGWKRASDGMRRFRKIFAFVPKGGGKSPWAAGTGVYLARCDGEMAAEVYAIANDRNQARTVHTNAKYMVEDAPILKEGAEILKDSIYWEDTRSAYIVLSSDASSAHGKRPHCLIIDEPHGFTGDKDRELYEALVKSLVKRRQPLLILISHAGTDDESLCYEEYEYATGLLTGAIQDDTFLPVVFEAKADEDWASPDVHARVNPGYGITVHADAIEAECLAALNDPRKRNDFLRYNLNRWVNQATAWLPVEWWDACNEDIPEDAELAILACAGGLDLAQKYDLATLTIAFRQPLDTQQMIYVLAEQPTGAVIKRTIELNYKLIIVPFFWIPEDTMREREKEDGIPYSLWSNTLFRGVPLVQPTEGSIIDYTRIFTDIRDKIAPRFPRLKEGGIGYDPAFATDLATKLRDLAGFKVQEVLQNYSHLSEPSQIFEALIKGGRVVHGGHRTLRNHIENVAIKTDDAGRIRPVKPRKGGRKRIDGVVGSIMGVKMLATVLDVQIGPQMFFLGGR